MTLHPRTNLANWPEETVTTLTCIAMGNFRYGKRKWKSEWESQPDSGQTQLWPRSHQSKIVLTRVNSSPISSLQSSVRLQLAVRIDECPENDWIIVPFSSISSLSRILHSQTKHFLSTHKYSQLPPVFVDFERGDDTKITHSSHLNYSIIQPTKKTSSFLSDNILDPQRGEALVFVILSLSVDSETTEKMNFGETSPKEDKKEKRTQFYVGIISFYIRGDGWRLF